MQQFAKSVKSVSAFIPRRGRTAIWLRNPLTCFAVLQLEWWNCLFRGFVTHLLAGLSYSVLQEYSCRALRKVLLDFTVGWKPIAKSVSQKYTIRKVWHSYVLWWSYKYLKCTQLICPVKSWTINQKSIAICIAIDTWSISKMDRIPILSNWLFNM